jgi:hypothetical protein
MSILDFEGEGRNYWNYTKSQDSDYTLTLVGVVKKIEVVQAYYQGKPQYWPEGNPKKAIDITVATDAGDKVWNFTPGGSGDKASNAMKAIKQAEITAGFPAKSVAEIGGYSVSISTEEAPEGMSFTNGRPYSMTIIGKTDQPFEVIDNPIPTKAEADAAKTAKQQAKGQTQIQQVQQQPVQQMPRIALNQQVQPGMSQEQAHLQQAMNQAYAAVHQQNQQYAQQMNQVPLDCYAADNIPF